MKIGFSWNSLRFSAERRGVGFTVQHLPLLKDNSLGFCGVSEKGKKGGFDIIRASAVSAFKEFGMPHWGEGNLINGSQAINELLQLKGTIRTA